VTEHEGMTRQIRQAWITRFDFLGGALPGGVEPSDIDQVLERRGHFLFLECKRPFQSVPTGQRILFDRLLELGSERHDVRLLHVVGNPPDAIERFGWWGGELKPGTVGEVRALVRRWWQWADSR
jgi:hypothetical protein